jgi:hypothetical protein
MRFPITGLLIAALTAMLIALAAALATPEPPGGHGVDHPVHAQMRAGGDGAARHAPVLWIGWAFGAAQIAFFVGVLALGASKAGRLRGLGAPLLLGGLVFAAIWTAMILAYRAYAHQSAPALILAFPLPTALMLFALWPMPIFFILLYFFGFNRWVLAPEDRRALDELLRRKGRAPEPGP